MKRDGYNTDLNTVDKYYTIEDVMTMLQISKSTAYKLAHSQGVPAIKVGNILRFNKTLFEGWLKKQGANNSASK